MVISSKNQTMLMYRVHPRLALRNTSQGIRSVRPRSWPRTTLWPLHLARYFRRRMYSATNLESLALCCRNGSVFACLPCVMTLLIIIIYYHTPGSLDCALPPLSCCFLRIYYPTSLLLCDDIPASFPSCSTVVFFIVLALIILLMNLN